MGSVAVRCHRCGRVFSLPVADQADVQEPFCSDGCRAYSTGGIER